MSWYAVSTRPHQESRAAQHLGRQGFDVWLPQFRKTRRHARRIETVAAALFPGYLFVGFDPARQPWRSINGTCGGESPVAVPDSFIAELWARRSADGFLAAPEADLHAGDRVRFRDGPFAECVAKILRLDEGCRVWLLLDLLGQSVTTTVARDDIVAAA